MAFYPHEDIPATAPTGGIFNGAKEVARQARDFACDLRSRHPGIASTGTLVGSPAQQWIETVWDNICANSPTPTAPPAKPPFSGGQCNTNYNIVFRDKIKELSTGAIYTRNGSTQLPGKLNGLVTVYPGGDPANGRGIGMSYGSPPQVAALAFGNNDYPQVDFEIVSITRVDGGVDNCGDPPPQYPPDFDPPKPGDNIKPYDPPNTSAPKRDWNITIPFIYVNGKAEFDISANFDIKIDVGGVSVKFDLGGVTINPGKDGDAPQPDLGDAIKAANDARDAANAAKNAADGSKKATEDRNKNDPDDPLNDPNKQNKDTKNPEDPKDEDAINRLLAVEVFVTQKPVNARTQWGDGAPDLLYGGWFEFKTKGLPHPRVPIHFDKNYFIAPPGADGYAYTLYNGFKGYAVVITAKAT